MLSNDKKKELIAKLYEAGTITFSKEQEPSVVQAPYTINLGLLNYHPQILKYVAGLLGHEIETKEFDLIAGPYTDIPLATTISLEFNWPMIFVREERKEHGIERLIEGNFYTGQKVVVVDDEIVDTVNTIQLLGRLEGSSLEIISLFLLLDRGYGSLDDLREKGYQCEALLTLNDVFLELSQSNKISPDQLKKLTAYLESEKEEFLLRQKREES